MIFQILRGGSPIESVKIDDSSSHTKKVNGEDLAIVKTESQEKLNIELGDTIEIDGQTYTMNQAPKVKKNSRKNYDYEMTFENPLYDLGKVLLLDIGMTEFALMGNADFFLDLIISNLNRVYGIGEWTKGPVATTLDVNLQFSDQNCLQALQKVIKEHDLFYSITGKQISLNASSGTSSGVSLEYGRDKGLYTLTRQTVSSKNLVTRVYAYGGDRNLKSGYRNFAQKLMFADAGANYVENNVGTYGLIEDAVTFDDIYPHYKGTVTSLGVDFLIMKDTNLDFIVTDYLLPGIPGKVHFNTGNLAGYEFEIQAFNPVSNEISLVQLQDSNGDLLPQDGYGFQIGDEYVILDIMMPDSYIAQAELNLQTEAQKYILANSEPRVKYNLVVDNTFMESEDITLTVGDSLNIVDGELGIDKDVTIHKITRSLANPYQVKVDLSDVLEVQLISFLHSEVIENNITIKAQKVRNIRRLLAAYQRTQALKESIFDPDGYFDPENIKPLSIETAMLTVGVKSQQMALEGVEISYGKVAGNWQMAWSAGSLHHFTIDPAGLKSWAIGAGNTGDLTTASLYVYVRCSRTANTGEIYASANQYMVDEGTTYYYFLLGFFHAEDILGERVLDLTLGTTQITGKVIKTGKIQSHDGLCYFDLDAGEIGGKIVFSSGKTDSQLEAEVASKIFMFFQDEEPTVMATGDMWIDTNDDNKMYRHNGAAWTPARDMGIAAALTAAGTAQAAADGKIVTYYQMAPPSSPSLGDLWIDTDNGNDIFRYNGTVWETAVNDGIAQAINDASFAQATADGKIDTFYQNDPPSGIGTGDLWFDTNDGNKLYRYNGSVWSEVRDEEIATALLNAATAQSTADGKIRTFYQAGTPTADGVGDLWIETDNSNKLRRWSGSAWNDVADTGIATALSDAQNAQATADGKIVTFYQSGTPSGARAGDLWLDSGAGNILKRYSGTVWQTIQDGDIATALTNAATADGKAVTAQNAADTAQSDADAANTLASTKISFFSQSSQPTALAVGDLWFDTDVNKIYRWNGSDWGQDVADSTNTIIDGGLVSTGRLVVKNNTAEQGGISGATSTDTRVIGLWLGSTYALRANAPFRVTHGGELTASKCTISSASGTGQRIVIASSDNSLRFFNSSNQEVITIDDNVDGALPGMKVTDGVVYVTGGATIYAAINPGNMTIWRDGTDPTPLLALSSSVIYPFDHSVISTGAATTSSGATGTYYGIKSWMKVNYAGYSYGGYFESTDGTRSYGVRGIASGGSILNYGGYFEASGTGDYGIYAAGNFSAYFDGKIQVQADISGSHSSTFSTSPLNINSNYSGYAISIHNDGNSYTRHGIKIRAGADVIGTSDTNYMLAEDGNGTIVGAILVDTTSFRLYNAVSTMEIKENIRDLDVDATALFRNPKAQPKKYNFKGFKPEDKQIIKDRGEDKIDITGFVIEDLMEVFPEAVKMIKDDEGNDHPAYADTVLIRYLVKAIVELDARIDQLESKKN